MQEILNKVREFQEAFGQTNSETPIMVPIDVENLRYELMKEENEEYMEADNLADILDACVDMAYILAGTINAHGLQGIFMEAFNRVHENNMSKLGPDGKPIYNAVGKVIKPEGFKPVELQDLLPWPKEKIN